MKHCIALSGSILFKPIWNVRSCRDWLPISIPTCHVKYPTVHSTRPFSTPSFVLSWCQHMEFAWKYVQNTFRNVYLQCAPILANNTTKNYTLVHQTRLLLEVCNMFRPSRISQRYYNKKKGKAVPLQAWSGLESSTKLRFPDFTITAQDGGKIVSLTHRPPLSPGNTPGTHFC
jgi:hypothetical protein